jgi:hypothetical protein
MILLKVIALGIKEPLSLNCGYQSGNILAIIDPESYCSDSEAKAITCNTVTF